MENPKAIRQVIWMASVLFFVQLGIFTFMLRPLNTHMWLSLAVLAVLGLSLMRISLSLVRELDARSREKK